MKNRAQITSHNHKCIGKRIRSKRNRIQLWTRPNQFKSGKRGKRSTHCLWNYTEYARKSRGIILFFPSVWDINGLENWMSVCRVELFAQALAVYREVCFGIHLPLLDHHWLFRCLTYFALSSDSTLHELRRFVCAK